MRDARQKHRQEGRLTDRQIKTDREHESRVKTLIMEKCVYLYVDYCSFVLPGFMSIIIRIT